MEKQKTQGAASGRAAADRSLMMNNASSGHKLGQLIGDWYEEYFVFPLLQEVAGKLNLFVDSRFVTRTVRSGKVIWDDLDGNSVDYDYVLELDGSEDKTGVPVAFIECFWRRGARHSKDKARDDSGKLMPMRATYPTARFLGIVAAGDFTRPARDLVRSRKIDLFYVPKEKIVSAFAECGLIMDYPDRLAEQKKAELVDTFASRFTVERKKEVEKTLHRLLGRATTTSYVDRVKACLSALPQEIRLVLRQDSEPVCFESVSAATTFLKNPRFEMTCPLESYLYQVTYSDGSEFEQSVAGLNELQALHTQIDRLTCHMNALCG
ncbi:MAG: hypothetical protein D3914_05715 [Candidatus Electrothrix sp. LOE2]|nr:hypothetical protein [Candidatus Electrothrix sp. LOE2]